VTHALVRGCISAADVHSEGCITPLSPWSVCLLLQVQLITAEGCQAVLAISGDISDSKAGGTNSHQCKHDVE
jgi:hypothetical protein